jgi:phage/plasmid-associated DNA primase
MEQCIIVNYAIAEKHYASQLYNLYSVWAKQNGEYVMSSRRFGGEIKKRLPKNGRDSKGNFYLGFELTEYCEQFIGRNYKAEDFI